MLQIAQAGAPAQRRLPLAGHVSPIGPLSGLAHDSDPWSAVSDRSGYMKLGRCQVDISPSEGEHLTGTDTGTREHGSQISNLRIALGSRFEKCSNVLFKGRERLLASRLGSNSIFCGVRVDQPSLASEFQCTSEHRSTPTNPVRTPARATHGRNRAPRCPAM